MAEFNITNTGVTVTDDAGNSMTISNDSDKYSEAVDAVLGEDYEAFRNIAFREDEDSEHDVSNWNGSPIYYLTKEQAMEQVSKSCGFWAYHDFGIGARCGRRYATVPTGFGPTAPEGYEWACVSIED